MLDVTILGAGPYGLAAAAALRGAGLDVAVLGEPMSFWDNMPCGMLLRSPRAGSSIGDPRGPLSIDAFEADRGQAVSTPIALEQFVEYGRWVQARAVPDVDSRRVLDVVHEGGAFLLTLDDGSQLVTGRLVIAAGIGYFQHVPAVFQGLPHEVVSHAWNHRNPSSFEGRRVLVVGAGQSALESSALLHEAGARVEIAARAATVHWLGQRPWLRSLGPVSALLYAPAEVGPPLLCRLVEAPGLVRRLPSPYRYRLDRRSVRPAGAAWLRARVVDVVPVTTHREVVAAEATADGVRVTFLGGVTKQFDHVLLGTGYRVDIARYPFLSRPLLSEVRSADGYPVLRAGFESSVPGLHFIGACAAGSFGPIMRFVAGTQVVGTGLTKAMASVVGRRRQRSAART